METQSSLINFTHTYELIQRYAMDIRKRYQDKLVLHDHIATGKLFNSARYEITSGNNVVEVSLNLEDVWKWVENDTNDLEQARMDADADFNALLDEALTLDIDECLDTLLALT